VNKQEIIEILAGVRDPRTGRSIVDLHMVADIQTDGHNCLVTLTDTGLDGSQKSNLNFACIAAIQDVYPQANINVHVVQDQTTGSEATVLPQVKNVIAVASGKGGVGKSTVSVNLALGLKKLGARVGLMDADLYGPSIPTMLGLQGVKPALQDIYGQPRMIPIEAYGISTISIGNIIEPEQAVVLRGPRLSGIIKQFISEVLWPELDFLIIDLPPGTGDIQLTLVQSLPLTGVVLVTTPQEVALVDAVKAMNMFLMPNINVPVLGVVENMSWFTPVELPDNKYYIFGSGGGAKLAKMANTVLLGQVPIEMSVRESGDEGKPAVLTDQGVAPETFVSIAQKTAEQIAWRNEMIEPTQIVKIIN